MMSVIKSAAWHEGHARQSLGGNHHNDLQNISGSAGFPVEDTCCTSKKCVFAYDYTGLDR